MILLSGGNHWIEYTFKYKLLLVKTLWNSSTFVVVIKQAKPKYEIDTFCAIRNIIADIRSELNSNMANIIKTFPFNIIFKATCKNYCAEYIKNNRTQYFFTSIFVQRILPQKKQLSYCVCLIRMACFSKLIHGEVLLSF